MRTIFYPTKFADTVTFEMLMVLCFSQPEEFEKF